MLTAIIFKRLVLVTSLKCSQQENLEVKIDNNELDDKKDKDIVYQALIYPHLLKNDREKYLRWNKGPVCRPICEPRFQNKKWHYYKPEPECRPVCEPKYEPKCRPGCKPRYEPECRPVCEPRCEIFPEYKKRYWEPKCKPVCEPRFEYHHEYDSDYENYKYDREYEVDCRERTELVCRPTCEPEEEYFRIMSVDRNHVRRPKPLCKPICKPVYHPGYGRDIKQQWELKYRPRWEPQCKPVCEPRIEVECRPKLEYRPEKKVRYWEPKCRPVCEPRYKHHKEYDSECKDSEFEKFHEYIDEREYESECREKREPVCRPICESDDKVYQIMSSNRNYCRQPDPECRPKCEPVCSPKCDPFLRPKLDYRCRPRWEEECRPICEPLCRPECEPILKKRRKHKIKRHVRRDVGIYVRLIRQVLLQGSFEVSKLAKCFAEEVKTKLLEGLQLIVKSSGNKALCDLRKLEQRITDVVIATNKNILRDTDALITNTNEEILDNVTISIRLANRSILSEIAALVAAALTPATALIQPLESLLAILLGAFTDVIANVPIAFKKLTQAEKMALEKIVHENKNEVVKEVGKLIEEFEQKLDRQLLGLTEEEVVFIRNIVDQSARKLLVDLEHILQQIGEGIIIILKGRNCEFRPLLFGGETEFGWNNLEDNLI